MILIEIYFKTKFKRFLVSPLVSPQIHYYLIILFKDKGIQHIIVHINLTVFLGCFFID